MHHGRNHAPEPAVLAGNGTQAVGEAQSHSDGLSIDHKGEIAPRHSGQPPRQEGRQHVSQHDRPDVARMGAGIAGTQHTENNAQRHAVEGSADEVVVSQNEQAEYAHVHQEYIRTHLGGNGAHMLRGGQQRPILLRLAAHGQREHDAQPEQDAAEQIHRQPGRYQQGLRAGRGGQFNAHGLEQRGVEEKRKQTHRHGGRIQIEALMHLRGMGQPRREEEADGNAHNHRHHEPVQVEAHHIGIGMAHQQVADQRRNAGGEQHGVDVGAQLFLLHQAVDDNAQHRRPDVQNVDAPGAEAKGQHKGQSGNIIGRRAAQGIQPQTAQSHQSHVQERRGIAAHGKIVGRDFCRLAENLPQAGKHGIPVRHTHRRDQKRRGKEGKKQLQERTFLQIF